jgi:hypothetical protein
MMFDFEHDFFEFPVGAAATDSLICIHERGDALFIADLTQMESRVNVDSCELELFFKADFGTGDANIWLKLDQHWRVIGEL